MRSRQVCAELPTRGTHVREISQNKNSLSYSHCGNPDEDSKNTAGSME